MIYTSHRDLSQKETKLLNRERRPLREKGREKEGRGEGGSLKNTYVCACDIYFSDVREREGEKERCERWRELGLFRCALPASLSLLSSLTLQSIVVRSKQNSYLSVAFRHTSTTVSASHSHNQQQQQQQHQQNRPHTDPFWSVWNALLHWGERHGKK